MIPIPTFPFKGKVGMGMGYTTKRSTNRLLSQVKAKPNRLHPASIPFAVRRTQHLWAKPGYGRRPVSRSFALWESSEVGQHAF